jgi:hypothetical protein
MNGTADRSGTMFDPFSLRERAYAGRRAMPVQAYSLRPIVPKPPSPPHVSLCHAGPMGQGVSRLCAGTNR